MKLQTKLIIIFVVITALVTAQGVTIFRSAQETTSNFEALVQHTSPAISALDRVKAAEAAMVQEVFSYGLKSQLGALAGVSMVNNQEIQRFQENWGAMETGLNEFQKVALEITDSDLTDDLRSNSLAVYQHGLTYLTMSTQVNDTALLAQAHTNLEEANTAFVATLQTALQTQSDQLRLLSEVSTRSASENLFLSLASAFALVATIVGLGFVVIRTVAKPIRKLDSAARQIAQGDYSQRIDVTSDDEIGQMTQSFNIMADAIEKRDLELSDLNTTLEQRVIETQQAREQAEQSDQVKSAFLASMSHELRTPLNAVINFTQFVVDGDTGEITAQQNELLTEVIASAKHLLSLINDVLDMSKIEAGSLSLFIEDDIDLNDMLKNVMTVGRGLLNGKPVQIEAALEDNLPLIRADQHRVLQIMLNIMSNACKFTETGAIKVSARQQEGEIVVSVTDNGPGIALDDQKIVFEAFKQTPSGLRQGGGTGLGMPIARSLAEAHGGRLWVQSEVGSGATFFVALPTKSEELIPVV
jgi:signal transduction histidine kinase